MDRVLPPIHRPHTPRIPTPMPGLQLFAENGWFVVISTSYSIWLNWPATQGSACAASTSGLPGSAKAVQRHWWFSAVFAASSGGRSIHSNSSRPWLSARGAAPCGASPKSWQHRCPLLDAGSRPWDWAGLGICNPSIPFPGTSGLRQVT